jgi:AcrR family transcriptional regulator
MSTRPDRITQPIEEVLIDAGYRLVTEEGVDKLTARRLATEAGVSTMVVYSRFGSVGAVAAAVRERGFGEFAALMEAVERSPDPIADLTLQGLLYLRFADHNPRLYTLMFQYTSPEWAAGDRKELLQHGRPTDSPAGRRAFEAMAESVRRADPTADDGAVLLRSGEVWSAVHGLAMLTIAGHLAGARDRIAESMFVTLAVGHGVDPEAARRALSEAQRRFTDSKA